ncbi:hypothetical protein B0T16DRAFT_387086 [Cercophora newfieldiana]|uniref:Uncharacterized protein n=1 Tax=Cercophora newfieldiana TaxID=92897 RepID=A0AA39YHL0_9PEZI|nr:hypothetical protein B0T16DRAFT_387086 [Cercophora newfieldiana]
MSFNSRSRLRKEEDSHIMSHKQLQSRRQVQASSNCRCRTDRPCSTASTLPKVFSRNFSRNSPSRSLPGKNILSRTPLGRKIMSRSLFRGDHYRITGEVKPRDSLLAHLRPRSKDRDKTAGCPSQLHHTKRQPGLTVARRSNPPLTGKPNTDKAWGRFNLSHRPHTCHSRALRTRHRRRVSQLSDQLVSTSRPVRFKVNVYRPSLPNPHKRSNRSRSMPNLNLPLSLRLDMPKLLSTVKVHQPSTLQLKAQRHIDNPNTPLPRALERKRMRTRTSNIGKSHKKNKQSSPHHNTGSSQQLPPNLRAQGMCLATASTIKQGMSLGSPWFNSN